MPEPISKPPEQQPGRLKGPALAMLIAAVVALVAPGTEQFEGKRNRPYYDPAHILTVCYGETEGIEDRIYSNDECAKKLRERMARDYAPKIIACVPDFADPRYKNQFGAALDASYNAGPAAVCRSRMARDFNAGRWTQGCNGFPGWYTTAKVRGKPTVLPGLVKRRVAEQKFCLTGRWS